MKLIDKIAILMSDLQQLSYDKGFAKGRLSKTINKCPHCNKIVYLGVKNEK